MVKSRMKNILFISIYPFPVNNGSRQHAYYFLKSLASHHHVHCVFFIPPNEKEPINANLELAGLGIKGHDICQFEKSGKDHHKHLKIIRSLTCFPSSTMESATHPQGLRTINACIEKNNIDTVFFEHFWLTGYAFKIGAHIKKVIVYHDLHHSIFKQMVRIERRLHRKFFSFLLFVKFYIFEKLLENKATLKIFLNPVEMASLPNNSVHIPHIVNPDIRFIPIRETKSFNLLFIGTYNHPPNRRSVQFIFENILPLLATVRFDFKIHVVGPDTEKFSHLINGSPYENHVIIHGFKQDINEAFREMDIALFPILDGGGIKTKLIDAMAAGVPVVTTPKGVEGLQGLPEGCMGIGASPEEIIEEINRLMSSYLLRVQRSLKGKSFIDREHSFSAFSQKVAQVFSRL